MKVKRWLSVLLCMLLCIGLIPTMAFAAELTYLQVNGTNILETGNYTVGCGDGTAVYDPSTKTLTLNHADITSAATGNTEGAISFDSGDLKIVLVGENTIRSSCHGITGQGGTLTITGEGSLNVTSVYGGITEGQKGNIIIDGTQLELNVSNSGGFSGTGIHAEGQLSIMNGSSVNALGETSDTMGIIGNAGITISDSSVTAKVLSEGSYQAVGTDNNISITNSYVEAATSSIYGDPGMWAIDLAISDNSEVVVSAASGNALYADNQLIVDDSVVNATAPGDYPAIYAYGDIAIRNGSDVTGSGNFRGIFTDSSITVNDSTVTASGATDEGIIAVDTFSIDNSKVTASSKPDDIIPAIVTYNLNITASEVTAKGGIQLWEFYSGDTTGRTFSITPAEGKLAEFKVDGTNWDGSAAVHFQKGTESPYDAAVTFNENEMNWLDAYRYIYIGEHIHSGGTATCTEKAICVDCGRTYGELDLDNHTGKVVWTQTETAHSSAYDCCGAIVVAEEEHEWENGICSECGYECQHRGGTATCTALAVCEVCGQSYGEKDMENHTGAIVWVQTETTHKQVYNCCNTEVSVEENHNWENGKCTVCDYPCAHTGGTATCSQFAVCDICGSQYGELDPDNHKAVSGWTQENGKHYHRCEYGCDTHLDEADCSGGEATCTAPAVCEVCERPYGTLNPDNHTGEITWTKTGTTHSSAYDCCGTTVVAEEAHEWENGVCSECGYECQHDGGTATCEDKAVCDICGEEYGEVNAINHTNLVKTEAKPATHMTEGNTEYWYCDGCDKYFSDEAGTQEIALADTVISKLKEHTADGTGWHSDETNHWNTCECGEKLNEAAHTFEWVIDKEATATEKGSKHEECTICGYAKAAVSIPATGTPAGGGQTGNTTSPQTGDSSNLTLWMAVLLAAGAGAALTGTAVYSRKKRYNR